MPDLAASGLPGQVPPIIANKEAISKCMCSRVLKRSRTTRVCILIQKETYSKELVHGTMKADTSRDPQYELASARPGKAGHVEFQSGS